MNSPLLPILPLPHKPRLLVVDDQPANVQVLYQALAADHQVLVATNGEQALRLAHDKQPALILLDVVMPGMDGHEVCHRLKADPATRDIPVIFVTAHSDEAEETRGLDAGAVDFIAKPVNPRIMLARVRTHLTLKQQSDVLRQMAFLDGLTGLYNRRGFDQRLQAEVERILRTGRPLGLVLADVDHFKRFNDHHGHQAGDDCLRRVGTALAAALTRGADLLARYGGEEFVAVLPETDVEGARAVALRMEQLVRAAAIVHGDSDVAPVVTISAGVAVLEPALHAPAGSTQRGATDEPGLLVHALASELLVRADCELYRAKHAGRGRVCVEADGA